MIQTEQDAARLKKELEWYIQSDIHSPEIQVNIEVCLVESDIYELRITPSDTNDGKTFHYSQEMVDFSRGHKLSCYITIEESLSVPIAVGVIF